ncbi:hypothetical protein BDV3_000641 [Batrachochytrium dendrobatidis]|uniref:Ribosomal protein S7p/S5e n=1 Tax=Batrachochytrium dendrobatidis (strain JEL423) TaxID=403673 RepID=A0A177W8B0_BATDL|nr:ribosomal protein S7p/S5e [Batrachochytrium dendrobatidis JEL423]
MSGLSTGSSTPQLSQRFQLNKSPSAALAHNPSNGSIQNQLSAEDLDGEVKLSEVNVKKEHPVIEQFVNNIMKSGNKAVARRIMSDAMLYIQTQTRQDPRSVIDAAVQKASPFVKVVSFKRRGKNVPTPFPLTDRQRNRTGILWIRDAALNGRSSQAAGVRIGKELLAILENKGAVLQKREQVHKLALANRSNVIMTDRKL